MPKIDEPIGPAGSPDFELALKLVHALRQLWVDQLQESGVDAVRFARISILSWTHVAATLAIDVNMSDEQFAAVCQAQYNELKRVAPKFAN